MKTKPEQNRIIESISNKISIYEKIKNEIINKKPKNDNDDDYYDEEFKLTTEEELKCKTPFTAEEIDYTLNQWCYSRNHGKFTPEHLFGKQIINNNNDDDDLEINNNMENVLNLLLWRYKNNPKKLDAICGVFNHYYIIENKYNSGMTIGRYYDEHYCKWIGFRIEEDIKMPTILKVMLTKKATAIMQEYEITVKKNFEKKAPKPVKNLINELDL